MIFKRRKDDRRLFKYLLPYGYMRRHLARVYGFEVKNGEFVASSMAKTNAHGFTWVDLLPLGVVMAMQSRKLAPVAYDDQTGRKLAELQKSVARLQADFNRHRAQVNAEIERLTVENMRLRLQLSGGK